MVTVKKGDCVLRVLGHTVNLWLDKGFKIVDDEELKLEEPVGVQEPRKRTVRRTTRKQ